MRQKTRLLPPQATTLARKPSPEPMEAPIEPMSRQVQTVLQLAVIGPKALGHREAPREHAHDHDDENIHVRPPAPSRLFPASQYRTTGRARGTERHHPTRSRPPRGGFSKMRTARQPAWRRRRPQPSPSAPPLRTQLRHSPRRAPRSVRSRASTSALSLGIGRAERQAARLEEMAARKLPRPKRVVLAVVEVAHPAAAIRRTAEERAVAPVRNRDRGGRATTGEHRPCSRARRRRHTPAIAPPRSRI